MNRRYIGILFIVLGLLAILLIIYFLFFFKNKKQEPAAPAAATKTVATSSIVVEPPKVFNLKPATQEELNEEGVLRLATSFAERFGSYSNHSNFQNMTDLELFMTERMKNWSIQYVKELKLKQTGAVNYFGITSKAITKKMTTFDNAGGKAKAVIQLQRREVGSGAAAASYGQSLEINLIKEGNAWKVDEARWGNKQQ
ncbi:hypothetical protein HGA64_00800 [Candidatus Falkowbacteria bacterium]|nr:hypothetical protein [Candidatus Falkowbacteria bacterium]